MSYSSSSSNNCSWPTQLNNRNFLSGIGFKFNLGKYPKVDFFCNTAKIPEVRLATATQPSYLKDIDVPGEKITYGDLSCLLYTSPSPRDATLSRMPSSA